MWPLVDCIEENFIDNLAQYVGQVTANLLFIGDATEYIVPERYKIFITRDAEQECIKIMIHEYDPKNEEKDIEPVLSAIAPLTKSVSLLPHSPKGAYKQMPEEGISEEEYYHRLAQIEKIDWSQLSGSDGQDELYCTSETCEIVRK